MGARDRLAQHPIGADVPAVARPRSVGLALEERGPGGRERGQVVERRRRHALHRGEGLEHRAHIPEALERVPDRAGTIACGGRQIHRDEVARDDLVEGSGEHLLQHLVLAQREFRLRKGLQHRLERAPGERRVTSEKHPRRPFKERVHGGG